MPVFRKPAWAPDTPVEDPRVSRLAWDKPLLIKLKTARALNDLRLKSQEDCSNVNIPQPPPPPSPSLPVWIRGFSKSLPFWAKDPTAKISITLRCYCAHENGGCKMLEVECHNACLVQPSSTATVCSIALHSSLMETQTRTILQSASGDVVEPGVINYNSQTCSFEIPDLPADPWKLLDPSRAGKSRPEPDLFEHIKSRRLRLEIRLYEKPDKSTLSKKILAQRNLPVVAVLGVSRHTVHASLDLFAAPAGRQRLAAIFADAAADMETFERRATGRIRLARRGGGPTLDCAEFCRLLNDLGVTLAFPSLDLLLSAYMSGGRRGRLCLSAALCLAQVVFERERRAADHSHSPYWPLHPAHNVAYTGPYPHPHLSVEQVTWQYCRRICTTH